MVEQLASLVINSLFSARPSLRHSAIYPVVTASTGRSPRKKYVAPNFFTPVPRRGKGKEKATLSPADHAYLDHLSECQEWSYCSMRHSVWCPTHSSKLMLQEFFTNRSASTRSESSAVPRSVQGRNRMSSNRAVHSFQRRHASHTSEAIRMTSPYSNSPGQEGSASDSVIASASTSALPLDPQKTAQKFEQISNLGPEQFNLEEAWNAYLAVVESSMLPVMSPDIVLTLIEKIVLTVERLSQRELDVDTLHAWASRLSGALQTMESRIPPASVHDRRRHCLLARSVAVLDDSDRALDHLRIAQRIPLPSKEGRDDAYAYEAIILSLQRRHGIGRVLDFLALEWKLILPLLFHMEGKRRIANHSGRSLRYTIHAIIASIKHPDRFVAREQGSDKTRREKLGQILIEFFCELRLPMPALNVYHELLGQELHISQDMKLLLVRALARNDAFETANELYESLPKTKLTRYQLSAGLQLYAQQGDHVRAEKYYYDLANRGWDSNADKALYMYAYVVQGNLKEALALFDKFYPQDSDGNRLNSPDLFSFSTLIHGLAQTGDLERINGWLEVMSKAGYRPDVYIYGSILKSFALRDDMNSIATVLSQMRAAGVKPNVVIYTTIMSVLARRGDVDGAEAIYRRAIRERIIPDRQMITTMMNAHVEAGSWEGVIRVFNRFKSAYSAHTHGLGIETYNTLLKAYVHIGAPYPLVFRLFSRFETLHVKPDAYSYSLLIQSACDAGLVSTATSLFRDMDHSPQSDKLISVYCLTIIMAGFIRARDFPKAKAVLDEMAQRGIEPTSVSIGTLLKGYGTYGRLRSQESLKLAEEFIKSLSPKDADWNRPSNDRKLALEHVYAPLLHAYARHSRPEDAERLFQDMINAGGQPTLGVLSLLLDSYRRTFRIEAVQQLWPQIVQVGLEYAESATRLEDPETGDPSSVHSRLKETILCIPLSIYIDALSAAGLHAQVAQVWREFKSRGLGFDSHNWNHLVVALVRAGDIERAFEAVEKVILPYSKRWQRPEDKIKAGMSDRDLDSPPTEQHSHGSADIVSGAEQRRLKYKVASRTTKLARRDPDFGAELFDEGCNVLRPLHILQQISPSWSTWRPHRAILQLLSFVLSRLEKGDLIEPVKPDGKAAQWGEIMDTTIRLEKQRQARQLLARLHKDYPQTVQLVLEHEAQNRRRLGNKEYERRYAWS
ncbi:hypothetical protein AX17_001217 [Amanita inopinata Kibby_2008]|nr:hypothetical protein AX17_001217 [Amanita inopinata Kibby_2008]